MTDLEIRHVYPPRAQTKDNPWTVEQLEGLLAAVFVIACVATIWAILATAWWLEAAKQLRPQPIQVTHVQ